MTPMNAEAQRDGAPFFDTNVLLYLVSSDQKKAIEAERLVALGGNLSVQVLNEFANVATRKLKMPWDEVTEILTILRVLCPIAALTIDSHLRGLNVAKRYGFSVYDAMIIGSALELGCETLYSEDLQHGQRIDGQLSVKNPFRNLA
jgi:predicted nucleic acid-binding protein